MAGHVVKVSVVADTKKFTRAFQGLAKETGLTGLASAGKAAVKTLAATAAASTAAITAAGGKFVSAAADMEQSSGSIEAVFKEGADQMKAYADTAATSVGLTKNEYQELGTLLGAQLKNGGTSIDQLAGKTNDLIGVAADLAAQFGGSTADAVGALSSALKGERDPIERYGVSLKQASIDAKAAELGFTKVGGAFSNEAQQATTLALIMEQTADAHGAFAREGDTLAHKTQVLKAHLGDFAAQLGALVLPAVTRVADAAITHLVPALGQLREWTQTHLIPALRRLAALFRDEVAPRAAAAAAVFQTTILPRLREFIDWIKTTAPPAIEAFLGFFQRFGPALASAASVVAGFVAAFRVFNQVKAIVGAAQTAFAALNATLAANPIFLVVAAVAALVAAFVALYQNCETFRAVVDAAWAQIQAAASAVAEWFQTTLLPALTGVWDALTAAWAAVWGALQQIWAAVGQPIADLIISVFQGVAANWDAIWSGVQATVAGAWQVVSTVITTALGVISGIIQTVTAVITGDWSAAWSGIQSIASSIWNGIKGVISGAIGAVRGIISAALGAISGAWSGAWSAITSFVSGAWSGITSAISSGVSRAVSFVGQLPSRALSALGGIGSTLIGAGKALIQGFIDGIKNMFSAVADTLGNLTSWLTSWKGPPERDARILTPAGISVIDGFIRGLESRYGAVRASLRSLTGMVEGADMGTLAVPAAAARGRTGAPTVITVTVHALTPTAETGRLVAEAIAAHQAVNGDRGVKFV